jgi:hypothetical protein
MTFSDRELTTLMFRAFNNALGHPARTKDDVALGPAIGQRKDYTLVLDQIPPDMEFITLIYKDRTKSNKLLVLDQDGNWKEEAGAEISGAVFSIDENVPLMLALVRPVSASPKGE